jgi:hypothetical protein
LGRHVLLLLWRVPALCAVACCCWAYTLLSNTRRSHWTAIRLLLRLWLLPLLLPRTWLLLIWLLLLVWRRLLRL